MAAVAETRHAHAVRLRGPAHRRTGMPALLPDVEAEDFVGALGQAIRATAWPRFGWPAALPIAALPSSGAPRALFQPIHRRFNLLLLDTHCDVFGTPRLDPRKIESSGFVVRRWVGPEASKGMPDADALATPAHWQAWQQRDGEALGWAPLRDARDFDADPDPVRRPLPRTGNAMVDAQLASRLSQSPAEATNRLYPLSPEVNDHARRTLLYGLVPAGEAQRKATARAVDYAVARAPGEARQQFVAHLSPYLRRFGVARALPNAGGWFEASWLNGAIVLDAATEAPTGNIELQRAQFVAFIQQMALEFQIDSERAAPLRQLLDEVPLWRRRSPVPAGMNPFERIDTSDFVVGCARVVTDDAAPAVRLPELLGPLPSGWLERFTDAALDLLSLRSAEARTLESRFDDADAHYAIRAFVRVKQGDGKDGCPPLLVWSEMTPLYRIAPWFASTGAPQARISLPPFDKESLRAMKPNVAFELPPSLQNLLMKNDPADLLAGAGKKGGELGIGWLCSFSIPIITICAFIALNLILSLLNIFLRWMPFVKICLPIPKQK